MDEPVWDIAQRRFDALKTAKQRKQRQRDIRREGPYHDLPTTIELGLLFMHQRGIRVTAKELSDRMQTAAALGTLPTSVEIDGEYVAIPPSAYRLKH